MITIIDYGLGNIRAFINVYNKLNIPVTVASRHDDLKLAKKIILPGVGSFDEAMTLLAKSGMKDVLTEMVLARDVPVLGVCVGMQMLASSSEEGVQQGLGWVEGEVKGFKPNHAGRVVSIPHMGWNDVKLSRQNALFNGLARAVFYFLHSYYFKAGNSDNVLATTEYYGEFACAVSRNNIYGVQFHPEKSHHYGTRLLKNFAEL